MPIINVRGVGQVRFPDTMSDNDIVRAIETDIIPQHKAQIAPAASPMEAIKGGAKQFGSSVFTGLQGIVDPEAAAKAGLERQAGITERPGASLEKVKSVYDEQGFFPAAKEVISEIPAAIAEQVPNLAATLGSARLGATAGAAFGPWGAGAGALLGAAVPSFLSQAGSNLERQAQEKQPVSRSSAYGAAVPQAAVDVFADKFAFGKLLGLSPAKLGTDAAEKLAGQSMKRVLATGVAKGIAAEVPGEVAQQMLERYQAGLSLTDDEARKEYANTAYQTALIGPVGALSNIQERGAAREQYAQEQQQLQSELAAINDERARQQAIVDEAQATANAAAAEESRKILADLDFRAQKLKEAQDISTAQPLRPLKEIIDEVNGVKRAPAGNTRQGFVKAWNEPSGVRAADPVTGIERELSMGEYHVMQNPDEFTEEAKQVLALPPAKQKPLIVFADGSVGTEEDVKSHLASLSEDQQVAARAKLYGYEPQKVEPVELAKPPVLGLPKYAGEKLVSFADGSLGTQKQAEEYIKSLPASQQNEARATLLGMAPEAAPTKLDKTTLTSLVPNLTPQAGVFKRLLNMNVDTEENLVKLRGELRKLGDKYAVNETKLKEIEDAYKATAEREAAKSPTAQFGRETARAGVQNLGGLGRGVADTGGTPGSNVGRMDATGSPILESASGTSGASTALNPYQQKLAEQRKLEEQARLDEKAANLAAAKAEQAAIAAQQATAEQRAAEARKVEEAQAQYDDAIQAVQEELPVVDERAAEPDVEDARPVPELERIAPGITKLADETEAHKTFGETLTHMKDKYAEHLTEDQNILIDKLKSIKSVDTAGYQLKDVSSWHPFEGSYRSMFNKVEMRRDAVDPIVTLLHEGVHAATVHSVAKHVRVENAGKPFEETYQGKTESGKLLADVFEKARKAANENTGFGAVTGKHNAFKNIREFIAEVYTNEKFQKFLASQPSVSKGKYATLWTDFVNAVKGMLGLKDVSTSMLSDAIAGSHEMFAEKPARGLSETKSFGKPRTAPATRLDGTPIKYSMAPSKSVLEDVRKVFNGEDNDWSEFADKLGALRDKIGLGVVSKRYTLERKALDKGIPAVSAKQQGVMRGDLIAQQADYAVALSYAGMIKGDLQILPSGMVQAHDADTNMMTISDGYRAIVQQAAKDLGSEDLAYDMVSAGWNGPRYASLARKNAEIDAQITALADEKPAHWRAKVTALETDKAYIGDWTESDKKTAAEAERRYGPQLKAIKDQWNDFRARLLKTMVDSGLYTQAQADAYLENMDFVPFYRLTEDEILDVDKLPRTGSSLRNLDKEFKLKGSDKTVADPLENLWANVSWMMQRAIKSNAALNLTSLLEQIGEGRFAENWSRNGHIGSLTDAEKKKLYHVVVSKDGEAKEFVLDDPNDMAAFSANPIITGAIWDLIGLPARGLRHGVTMMPQFVFNQAFEDPVRAAMVSGNKAGIMKNIKDTWTSIAKNQFTAEHSPGAEALYSAGVIGQKDIMSDQEVKDIYMGRNKQGWRKGLFFVERLAQGSDLGAREAIYNNAVEELVNEGYDRKTAESLALSRAIQYMPHQQVGTSRSLAYLRRMMPFVNSPIQGLARDVAAARGRISGVSKEEGKKRLAYRLAKYAAFTAMYAAFMSGDDDYENLTEDQKDNYFIIGGARIPAPQEIRPFKVLIERGTRAWVLNAQGADIESSDIAAASMKKAWELISGLAMPIPTAIRPVLENMTNYDIHGGRPIVGAGQAAREPAMQYTDGTSELAKAVGAAINYSPIKIDHLLSGYFGYAGQTVQNMTNMLASDRPSPSINELMFVGTIAAPEYGTGPKAEAYELLNKVAEVKATMKAIREEGDADRLREYMTKNRGYLGAEGLVNSMHKQITNIRRLQGMVSKSDMAPDEKRARIDELKQNELASLARVHEVHRMIIEANNEGS